MPTVRDYPQVFEIDATDAISLSRIGVGTVFIDGDDIFPIAVGYPKTITVTTYTVQSIDNGQTLDFVNAAASTALVPPNLEPEGFECFISQGGTGQVTVQPHAGSSLVNEDGFFSTDKQYGELKLKQFSASSHRLFGRTSGGIAWRRSRRSQTTSARSSATPRSNTAIGTSAGSGQGRPGHAERLCDHGPESRSRRASSIPSISTRLARDWLFNTSSSADGVFCYSATPATHAHLTDLLTFASGATFTADRGRA